MRTWTGSRAGDPLGDLLFNICFAALLRRVTQQLVGEGLVAMLPHTAVTDILMPVKEVCDHVCPFADGPYLDDDAYCI